MSNENLLETLKEAARRLDSGQYTQGELSEWLGECLDSCSWVDEGEPIDVTPILERKCKVDQKEPLSWTYEGKPVKQTFPITCTNHTKTVGDYVEELILTGEIS